MTRLVALALLLASCGPSAQRDAALAMVVAGATASVACGIANGQTKHRQFELGACMIVGGTVAIGGGVVLHSQLEAGDRQED